MTQKRIIVGAGGLVLTVIAQAVLAQSAPEAPQASGQQVEQITITVNKREERLQDVPASTAVVQAQQLDQQNITNVPDLARAVPTLNVAAEGFNLRGVGGLSYSLSAESSVGILLDGVSLSGAGMFPPNLFDVERVEVLEGPQGTLFGKNATAGVINIVTKAPSTTRFGGQVRADVQNRGGRSAQGVVNLPISDSFALRLSVSVQQDPRTVHNLSDDSYDNNLKTNTRLRALWKPTNELKVNLIADESVTKYRGGARWAIYQSTPGSALTMGLAACGVTVGPENTDSCLNVSQRGNRLSVGGTSAQVDYELGDYTLTSVTALRHVKNDAPHADVDSINFPAPDYSQPEVKKYRNFSQEFRLASPDADWGNFVAGVYYFKGKVDQDLTGVFTDPGYILGVPATFGARNLIHADILSSAVFGQGTIKVAPRLAFNLGARFGHEDIQANRTGSVADGAVAPFVPDSLIPVSGKTTDNYASWRLGAQYDLSRDNMAYVTLARGYKGPAVNDNATSPAIPLVVRPEIPTTVEIGLKNLFLKGRAGLNLAASSTRLKNYQAQSWSADAKAFVFTNAPTAKIDALTVSFYAKPSNAFVLNGGLAYTIAKYGPGYLAECAQGSPPGCTRDATGDQIGGTPKLRATLAGEYSFPVGAMRASLGADMVYTSEKVYNPADPPTTIPAATIFGARLGLRSADNNWGVSLYARNLFDKFSPTSRSGNVVSFATGDAHSYFQFVGQESRRLIGLSVDAKF